MIVKESAMKRSDAIDKCMDLGLQFTKHFNKIMDEGINSPNFNHHCLEMQSWFDKIQSITLKPNNISLRKNQIWDWFFTVGGDVDDYIKTKYIEKYEEFYLNLMLNPEKKIVDIIKNLLK